MGLRTGFFDPLTRRERQILALIAAGNSSKEIAATLGLAFKTVTCHRARIQEKLDARNTADLTRAAVYMGLVSPRDRHYNGRTAASTGSTEWDTALKTARMMHLRAKQMFYIASRMRAQAAALRQKLENNDGVYGNSRLL